MTAVQIETIPTQEQVQSALQSRPRGGLYEGKLELRLCARMARFISREAAAFLASSPEEMMQKEDSFCGSLQAIAKASALLTEQGEFGDKGGIRRVVRKFHEEAKTLTEYLQVLSDSMAVSFTHRTTAKDLTANLLLAVGQVLHMSRNAYTDSEGRQEINTAREIASALSPKLRNIQESTEMPAETCRHLAAELEGSCSTLLGTVARGSFGLNYGIKTAVADFTLAAHKLLGAMALVEEEQNPSGLEAKLIQDAIQQVLKQGAALGRFSS